MAQGNGNKGGAVIGIIIVVVFIILACVSCSGGGSSKKDIARDPNGFLGYSDDFWEWAAKQ